MRKTLRLGLVAGSGLAALAFSSVAMAAYSPSLIITNEVNSGTGQTSTGFGYNQTNADDPLAHVQFLAPAGYSVTLSQSPGTQIGTVEGSVFAGELGGVTVPIAGTIVVGDPTSTQLQAVAKQCTGANATVIWLLNITAAGQSLPAPVPVFVNPITSGMTSAFASASMELCLPPPPLATFQIKVLQAIAHVNGVFAPPATAGEFRWTAVNTPYKADNSVNLAGTIETQAIEQRPLNATITTKRITKKRTVKKKAYTDIFYSYSARISGQVLVGGQPAGGVPVDIMSGEDKLMTTTTSTTGDYSATLKLKKTTTYHAVATRASTPVVGASCIPPLPLGPTTMPCGNITSGAFAITTGERTVVKPKLTHKRIKHKKKKKRPKH
jgi:hypothetical protein